MHSNTKVPVPIADVRTLARLHLGEDVREAQELSDGMYNAAYRVRLSDGTTAVLKVAPPEGVPGLAYERSLMRAEVAFFELARGRAPVPEVLAADFTRTALDRDVLFLSHLEGAPLRKIGKRLSESQRYRVRAELGEAAARLHQVQGTSFGYERSGDPSLKGATWPAAFASMYEAALADAVRFNVHLGVPLAAIREALDRHLPALAVVERPALVHFDLWDGNVFAGLHEGEAHLTGIIDGERMFWGDPLADLVSTSLFRNPAADIAFNDGYARAGGTRWSFDEEERMRLALYSMYICTLMLVEAVPRGYRGIGATLTNQYVRGRLRAALRSMR